MIAHSKFRIKHLTFLFFLVSICSFAQKQVPELWGQRVHDDVHILKSETVDLLEKRIKVYEDSTSNQIAILIVQSLDKELLEEYSLRVVEKWKLGEKKKDNGVLLLVAVEDHKMRIEVGHGLEGVLTDAQSNRIIRNDMAPNFRRGDYDAGILAGIDGIIKTIKGEYKAEKASDDSGWIIFGVLFGVFCIIVLIVTFVNELGSNGNVEKEAKPVNKYMNGKKRSNNSTKSTIGAGLLSGIGSGGSLSSSSSSSGGSFLGGGGSFGGGGSSGSW